MKKIILWSIALLFLSCGQKGIVFKTDSFGMEIDSKGFIVSWTDVQHGRNYFPQKAKAPLLALYKDGAYIMPDLMQYDQANQRIGLTYPNGSVASLKINEKPDYVRLELVSVEPRNEVQAIVWGPYPTTLDKWIGETVGVVRNDDYAIGVQALNIITGEGLPDMRSHKYGQMYIDPLPGQVVPDSLKGKIGESASVDVNQTGDLPEYVRIYRGNAARKTQMGSEILFYALDRRIPRTIGSGESLQYIEPIEVDFAGSAIALFGCPENKVLDIIEKIELEENLPHPEIDGTWIKRHSRLGEAYLLYEGGSQEDCIKYADAFGFKLVHIGDVFQTWGQFGLHTRRFPKGAEDIRKFTDKAREKQLSIGVHTLTMFTSTNDAYVSPVPSDSLCKTGSGKLQKDISADSKEIEVDDPAFFLNTGNTHTVKIGKELIGYDRITKEKPYRLLACTRGQFGTIPAEHKVGSMVDKLANNSYRGFYPDNNLQEKFAIRLAEVCNETGIDLMDFDGFDLCPTGQDTYGDAKFIDLWYKNLDRARLACGSQTSHYYWHIYSFMNWGEPWYSALRESQVNYRIENQRYFQRNYMPGMLGWFSIHPDYRPEEIEWIQARSAAFNAGYLLRVDERIENNGFKEQLFESVREWQKARHAKAFTKDQLERMKNPKNEFHLEKSAGGWLLYPVTLVRGFEHTYRMSQTGEDVTNKTTFRNPYDQQAVQFFITCQTVEGDRKASVDNLSIVVNNSQTINIPYSIKADDRFYCDGQALYLCDKQWNKLKKIDVQLPEWKNGENEILTKSRFSGENAPRIKFEFKAMGMPENVVI